MSSTLSAPVSENYRAALDRLIADVVGPAAAQVDKDGAFPTQNIEALGAAGILGLLSATEVGGSGLALRDAADVIERLSGACGSTAMVVLMHYAAVTILEPYGPRELRQAIAQGRHLSTLAFSEVGSRTHFWVPLGTATRVDGHVQLDAQKSWVTSAAQADSYVWSSRAMTADGPMTMWLVPSKTSGLSQPSGFDGLGLRGNGSTPISAQSVELPAAAMLGADGGGLDLALTLVLPAFQVLSAPFSLGVMEAVTPATPNHLNGTP